MEDSASGAPSLLLSELGAAGMKQHINAQTRLRGVESNARTAKLDIVFADHRCLTLTDWRAAAAEEKELTFHSSSYRARSARCKAGRRGKRVVRVTIL
jgi:hypothetical protein